MKTRYGHQNRHLQGFTPKRPGWAGDTSSLTGATALANEIKSYWRSRGYSVETRLERGEYSNNTRIAPYLVRTDMINGLPKDHPANVNKLDN